MKAQHKIFIALLVSFVLFAGLFALLIVPQVWGIVGDTANLVSQKEERAKLTAEQNNLEDFLKFFSQHQPETKKFQNLFPDPESPVDFLSFLERISADSQLVLQVIPSSSQKASQDAWPSLVFQISSKGNYGRIRQFVQKLENAPYALQIQSVSFAQRKEASDKEALDLRLSVKVYTQNL